jgi:hypothetical protein
VLAYFWVVTVVAAFFFAFSPQPEFPEWTRNISALDLPNPAAIQALEPVNGQLLDYSRLVQMLLVSLNVLALISLVVRYRAGAIVERLQIKAVGLLATAAAFGLIIMQQTEIDQVTTLILNVGITVFAVGTFGAAIVRYRLFEIDRIISRTVAYALVVGSLGLIYSVGAIWLPSKVSGDSPLYVAGSTLAVAAMFNPVRRRVLGWVDRRFNRSHFDAEQILVGFASHLRKQTDLVRLTDDFVAVVQRTMQPSSIGAWIRDD